MGILNLWKLRGLPTSYNPLPLDWKWATVKPAKVYRISFKAKSDQRAALRLSAQGGTTYTEYINLTPQYQYFERDIEIKDEEWIGILDESNVGDINIIDIVLTEKPLGKLTLNGVPGFKSGKWDIHPNAVIENDRKLVLNADASVQFSYVYFECEPNTEYTFIVKTSAGTTRSYAQSAKRNGDLLRTDAQIAGSGSRTFVSASDARKIRIRIDNDSTTGVFTFEDIMVIRGKQIIPYKEKQGDKIVESKVISENLFCDELSTYYDQDSGRIIADPGAESYYRQDEYKLYYLTPGETYTFQATQYIISSSFPRFMSIHFRREDGSQIVESITPSYTSEVSNLKEVFIVPEGTHHVLLRYGRAVSPEIYHVEYDNIMISKGSSVLPFEEFEIDTAPLSKRQNVAEKGLEFHSVAGEYVRADSVTFDEVELEITPLIGNMRYSTPFALGNQTTTTGGFYWFYGDNGMFRMQILESSGDYVNDFGYPFNYGQKYKIRIIIKHDKFDVFVNDQHYHTSFSDSSFVVPEPRQLLIGAYDSTRHVMKGTYHSFKAWHNGEQILDFDFTEPIGKVVNPSENLLPDFDSGEWNFNPNIKVIGKNVVVLNSTADYQLSSVRFIMTPNEEYMATMRYALGRINIVFYDSNDVYITETQTTAESASFTAPSNVSYGVFRFDNRFNRGELTFIDPAVRKVTNQEGILNGGAKPKLKTPKRLLHRKR